MSSALAGRIEIERRRVLKDGRVKLKLSLLGAAVDKCGICLSQFKEGELAVLGVGCRHACVFYFVLGTDFESFKLNNVQLDFTKSVSGTGWPEAQHVLCVVFRSTSVGFRNRGNSSQDSTGY